MDKNAEDRNTHTAPAIAVAPLQSDAEPDPEQGEVASSPVGLGNTLELVLFL